MTKEQILHAHARIDEIIANELSRGTLSSRDDVERRRRELMREMGI